MTTTTPFGRPELFIFAPTEPSSKALHEVISMLVGSDLPHKITYPETQGVCATSRQEDINWVLDGIPAERIRNVAAIVDLTDDDGALRELEKESPAPVLSNLGRFNPGVLCLSYPEVLWIFIVSRLPKQAYSKRVLDHHFFTLSESGLLGITSALRRHSNGFRAWFDPTGLRMRLRDGCLPDKFAASVDEETSYTSLNGYALYRQHRATYVVPTFSEMDAVLNRELGIDAVVIEDVELLFDDVRADNQDIQSILRPTDESDVANVLRRRANSYKILDRKGARIIVSAASARPIGQEAWLMKPYGGMYSSELVIDDVAHAACRSVSLSADRSTGGNGSGHSAPYRKQHIAERLVIRAKAYAEQAYSAEQALHAALLAREARILLDGKTFTLSLEALSLQHQMEVTAECAFAGSTSTLNAERRFKCLEKSVDELLPNRKKHASFQKYNALIEVTDRLKEIYGSFSQFEDQEIALHRLRCYRVLLKYFVARPTSGLFEKSIEALRRAVSFIFGGFELYFNTMMRGVVHIALASLGWIVVFALLYASSVECRSNAPCAPTQLASDSCYDRSRAWLAHSAVTFFALQQGIIGDPKPSGIAPDAEDEKGPSREIVQPSPTSLDAAGPLVLTLDGYFKFWLLSIIEMVMGILHVGIFVAYLFQKISR